MALNIIEAVESSLSPDTATKLAGSTQETPSKTKAAMSAATLAIVAGLIRRVTSKGGAAHLLSTLGTHGSAASFTGGGEQLVTGLLGSHAAGLTDVVARSSGVSQRSASGIMGMVAPIVAGTLGREVASRRLDASGLTDVLLAQKTALLGHPNLPAGLSKVLADSGTDVERVEKLESAEYFHRDVTTASAPASRALEAAKRKFPLWPLLAALGIAALLLFALFAMRGRGHETAVVEARPVETPALPPAPLAAEPTGQATPTSAEIEGFDVRSAKLNFDFASTQLVSGDEATVDRIAAVMKAHPSMRVRLEGHTDSVGDQEYNARLSNSRAAKVRAMLVERGIASDRMEPVGRSKNAPIAPNDSQAGRLENRRVSVIVLEP